MQITYAYACVTIREANTKSVNKWPLYYIASEIFVRAEYFLGALNTFHYANPTRLVCKSHYIRNYRKITNLALQLIRRSALSITLYYYFNYRPLVSFLK